MNEQGYIEKTKAQAIEAFRRHHLILDDRENGRWRIARKYDDGSIEGQYATEVISLWGGRLYVGGDIDDCTFAYYSGGHTQDTAAWHLAKLRWMGEDDDLGYYVVQKAAVGMTDGNRLTKVWDSDVALYDLNDYIRSASDEEDKFKAAMQEAINVVRQGGDEREMCECLASALDDGGVDILGSIGMVTAPRVIYAWAAMHRLCELIREKDEVATKESWTPLDPPPEDWDGSEPLS